MTKLIFLLFTCLLLTSCVSLNDPESAQEQLPDVVGNVHPGQTIGQTFVSRRARMDRIQLWLRIAPETRPQSGSLTVELFHHPEDAKPILSQSLSFQTINGSFPVTIAIPTQNDPPGQTYFIQLSISNGSIQVYGRSEDAYPDGKLLVNKVSVDADLAFRLSYDYGTSELLSDLLQVGSNIWLILPLVIVLWLPGQFLLLFFTHSRRLDWGEQTALTIGLSLGVIPLLMTWTTFIGLRWNRTGCWAIGILLALLTVWSKRKSLASIKITAILHQRIDLIGLALVGILVSSLAVRLVMVRDLSAPPWVDSVHHAMITRMILDEGAFPKNYAPYLNIEAASYHPGFHSLLAAFTWLSGLPLTQSMLLLGQVLNALTILSVYLLTNILVKNRKAALVAALVTGLFTPMPAYYTSWGRYPQLASLVILPAALAFIKVLIEKNDSPQTSRTWKLMILGGIACAGLFMTHYRVAIFLACLLLADFITQVWHLLRKSTYRTTFIKSIFRLGFLIMISILLVLPWLPSTVSSLLLPKIGKSSPYVPAFSDFTWAYLTTAYGKYALWLGGLGFITGLFRRRRFVLVIAIWFGLLFFLANLGTFRLPGRHFINNNSVEIILFIPISLLAGYLISSLVEAGQVFITHRWRWIYHLGWSTAGVVAALFAMRALLPILNPITFLFREADRPALDWIAQNIPANETVVINPFAWGYNIFAGNDGGYWIIPLSGRKTIPPPVLYGLGNNPAEIQAVSEICQQVIEKSKDPEGLYSILQANGLHYIYLGRREGVLSARLLISSPRFELIYSSEGARVFHTK